MMIGTPKEEIYDYFLGGVPQFNRTEVISDALLAREYRYRVSSLHVGVATVHTHSSLFLSFARLYIYVNDVLLRSCGFMSIWLD